MKRYLLSIICSAVIQTINAQEITSGRVTYEQVVQLEIKLDGEAAHMASMLPKERKSEKILWFNEQASLFENSNTAKNEDVMMNQGGANVTFRMAEPDNKVYTDLAKGIQTEQRDFMTRQFLIEDRPTFQWKITGKQKLILDYPCMEATTGDADKMVTAWFTPVIPVSTGPGTYGGLPGLILSIETNEGKNITTAIKVETGETEAGKISKPDKGRKVSREEFDKIVEEKMQEMGAQPGAGGQHIMIRIQR